jgi:hypothetical protein
MSGVAPRVVESSLRSFQCAYERYVEAPFALGQLVAVREGPALVFGVVAEVASGPEDPTRPLQARGLPGQKASEVMAENPEIRLLLRTRVTVVTCGYREGEMIRPQLPPSPAPLLAEVQAATPEETVRLAADGEYLALLLPAPACDDAVIAAAVRQAAPAFDGQAQEFRVRAGKELARLLKAEPARLASIIRGIAT